MKIRREYCSKEQAAIGKIECNNNKNLSRTMYMGKIGSNLVKDKIYFFFSLFFYFKKLKRTFHSSAGFKKEFRAIEKILCQREKATSKSEILELGF